MAGYTRQDTLNNIANGNVIDADDFDAEYNALEGAFNATTGHSHDGSAGEGAPIEVTGPSQQFEFNANAMQPAAGETSLDLGLSALAFDNIFVNTVRTGANKRVTITDNEYDVSSGGLTFDVAGDITLDADGADVILSDAGTQYGTFTNSSGDLVIKSGTTTAATFTGANLDLAGTLDVTGAATLDSTLSVTGAITATGGLTGDITGDITGDVTGDLTGNVTGNVTGTVSSISNHDTDDLTEGATNLYYTNARARSAISATGSLSYNSGTGVMSFTQGSTDTVSEGSTNLYYTNARARAAVSVTDSGGDGSLAYNSSTGVITYTGPSASEVRGHFSSGTGIDIAAGVISGEDASDTNKGIAKFNATDFNTSSGDVSLKAERIQDIVGGMVSGNTESGLSVTYQDTDGTLDFSLTKDPVITLTGDVTGSGTMTNLGNVSITTAVANDSHNHDGRYFTESESDSRYVRKGAASTITSGSLRFNDNIELALGSSADAEFFVDGSHMYLDLNSGIGNFYIRDGSTTRFTFNDNGNFTSTGSATASAFYYSSDERLKENITPVTNALDVVTNLRGVEFDWKEDGTHDIGVIAQEVEALIPEAVKEQDHKTVSAAPIIAYLIEAVKELKAEVDRLNG